MNQGAMKLNPAGTQQGRGLAAARSSPKLANPRPVKVDSAVAIAPPATASQVGHPNISLSLPYNAV